MGEISFQSSLRFILLYEIQSHYFVIKKQFFSDLSKFQGDDMQSGHAKLRIW